MAVQQETPIGDEDLDALMAELEAETAGMVAPPPAAKATPVVESDPLDGLDEGPTVFAPTTTAKAEPVVELDPTDPRDDGVVDLDTDAELDADAMLMQRVPADSDAGRAIAAANAEPSIDDELAALEAEMGDAAAAAKPAAKGASLNDKFAAVAAKAKETHPSDVPKMKVKEHDAFIAPPGTEVEIVNTAGEKVGEVKVPTAADKNLDDKLKEIAETMPKNPNVKPTVPAGSTAGLAGLGFDIDVDQFRRDISVTETNLDNCMMEQAGLIAYYIAQHAGAEAQAARTKVQVEIGEAKLYAQHRATLAAGTEKVTEKLVENAVRMDPKYGAIQNRLIEAEARAAVWKGCVEALKQRRDMIIQLGADRREDGKGAVRIMAAEHAHADLKTRAAALAKRGE